MKRFALALCLAACAAPVPPVGPAAPREAHAISEAELAALMIGRAAEQDPPVTLRYEAERHQLVSDSGKMYLPGLLATYRRTPPEQRAARLDKMLALATGKVHDFEMSLDDASPRLLPLVRDTVYFAVSGRPGQPSDVPSRPLAEGFGVGVALDGEEHLTAVSHDMLQRWGAKLPDVEALALINLRAYVTADFRRVAPGVLESASTDPYAASRLLLPELFRRLPVTGAPVVSLPTVSRLLVAGDRDEAALLRLADLIEARQEDPHVMNATPLVLEGDRWVRFRGGSSRVQARFHTIAVNEQVAVYQTDQQFLAESAQAQGIDVFVAPYSAVATRDGVTSWTSWAGVRTWLPRTEWVALGRYRNDTPELLGMVPFDALIHALGPAAKQIRTSPARWELVDPPSDEWLRRLHPVSTAEWKRQLWSP